MRKVSKIILHCSATPEGRWHNASDIKLWHLARGFRTIGYHYVILLDGTLEKGRPESEIGAHCRGHNADSIGICYIGGLDKVRGVPKDTRTPAQKKTMHRLVNELLARYPGATVHGHCEFAAKACPCFDVSSEF